MANYPKSLARDTGSTAMQEYPAPFPTVARGMRENAVVSSVVAINPNTTTLEIGVSGGQGVVIRWVPLTETVSTSPFSSVVASGLGANYDHFVPPASYRRFVVPKETQGLSTPGQAGSVNGLYQRLAIVNAGTSASSVLVSEF